MTIAAHDDGGSGPRAKEFQSPLRPENRFTAEDDDGVAFCGAALNGEDRFGEQKQHRPRRQRVPRASEKLRNFGDNRFKKCASAARIIKRFVSNSAPAGSLSNNFNAKNLKSPKNWFTGN